MDEVVKKSTGKEFVDFVYNVSHMWSQRHPERAKEILNADCSLHGVTKQPLKGVDSIQKLCFGLHDSFEDFHYEIHSVTHEGKLEDQATITVEWSQGGKMKGAFGDIKKTHDKIGMLYGCSVFKAVKGKASECWIYLDMSRSAPHSLEAIASMHQ